MFVVTKWPNFEKCMNTSARHCVLVLLGLNIESLHNWSLPILWRRRPVDKMVVVVLIIYKMSLANQGSDALKPCWLYISYRADPSGLIDLENKNSIFQVDLSFFFYIIIVQKAKENEEFNHRICLNLQLFPPRVHSSTNGLVVWPLRRPVSEQRRLANYCVCECYTRCGMAVCVCVCM